MTESRGDRVNRRRKVMLIYYRQGFAYTGSRQYPLQAIDHFLLGVREASSVLRRLTTRERRGLRIVEIDL